MSKKLFKISVLLLTLSFLSVCVAAAKEVTLKGVSAFAEGTRYSKNFERFVEKVNKEGKGLVQINYIGGGGKVMSPFEVGNAVRGGVVDRGLQQQGEHTPAIEALECWKIVDVQGGIAGCLFLPPPGDPTPPGVPVGSGQYDLATYLAVHHPGLSEFFLGSTAARIMRYAKCLVHILRSPKS